MLISYSTWYLEYRERAKEDSPQIIVASLFYSSGLKLPGMKLFLIDVFSTRLKTIWAEYKLWIDLELTASTLPPIEKYSPLWLLEFLFYAVYSMILSMK